MEQIREPYQVFDDMIYFYNALISDILNAKKTICIEVFRFHDDFIAKRICQFLTQAVQRGVNVKLLVDGWGTPHAKHFFKDFEDAGGKLRIWNKLHLTFNWDIILKSHHRNHRKIFTFDNEISYVGSGNISDYNLEWRELMIRIKDKELTRKLNRCFHYQYVAAKKIIYDFKKKQLPLYTDKFEVLRDSPSLKRSSIKRKYIKLINEAQNIIIIESPYFLPSSSLRFALEKALQRGVKTIIITPKHSDIKVVDVLRNRYIAPLFEKGADIRLYKPNNLHAKLLLVDNQFSIGSANFDYRSFRYQHEIVIIGQEQEILDQLKDHVSKSMIDSETFDYDNWKNRSLITKIHEQLIIPIRQFL